MEQQIPNSEPTVPELTREPRPAPKNSADSFVDAALDFITEEETARADKAAERKALKEQQRPADDDEREEAPKKPLQPRAEEEEEAADSAEEERRGEVEEEPEHDDSGSRDRPFTVKDLPEDKFIELTIEGKKEVLSLAELGKGFVREKTFHRRIGKTEELTRQATELIKQAQEIPKQVQTHFREFVRDPEQIFEFFTETADREQVLEAVARRLALLRRAHRENPDARLEWLRQRDEKRLAYERQQFQEEQQRQQQEQQRQRALAEARAIFDPGWAKGLVKAGSPKLNPQQHRELMDEVLIRCQQRRNAGEEITPDTVATFVVRACQLLELKPSTAQKPKPAPLAPPKPETNGTVRRGVDWGRMTKRERTKNPDFFLQGLKSRDLR